jgi:hypothetical protein
VPDVSKMAQIFDDPITRQAHKKSKDLRKVSAARSRRHETGLFEANFEIQDETYFTQLSTISVSIVN